MKFYKYYAAFFLDFYYLTCHRCKTELLKLQKQKREEKFKEEQQKRKENEAMFIAWLDNKRQQAHAKFKRNQQLQAESAVKMYPAPTAHL